MNSKDVIKAVIERDWEVMLSIIPEGVEYRGDIYNKVEDFAIWDTYDHLARYVKPAQDMLINSCLTKVLEVD